MQFLPLFSILASFIALSAGATAGLVSEASCKVTQAGFIGKDKNVKLQYSQCDNATPDPTDGLVVGTDKATGQSNAICGASCMLFS